MALGRVRNLFILFTFLLSSYSSAEECKLPPLFKEPTIKEELRDIARMFSIFDENPTRKKICNDKLAQQKMVNASEVLPPPSSDVGELSVVSEKEARSLFDNLKNDCRIPFEFNLEGCYPRAHAMAKALEDKGIAVAKVFFRGPISYRSELIHQNIEPSTHVAVVIGVKSKSGDVQPYVLDPSVASEPLSLDRFKAKISFAPESLYVQFTNRFKYLGNSEYQTTNRHPRPLYEWSASHRERTMEELEGYRLALPQFKAKNCEAFDNTLGKAIGSDNISLSLLKKHCYDQ
ncbi:MAG: hypothetical protein KDD50_05130 [Bdellovibrionales bacterium]|nr:hypothetical protein [Bdellovibrionales bacterium]